jgi:hypothetical protein
MNVLSIDQVNERRVDSFYHSFVMALRNRPLFVVVQHEPVHLGDSCNVANVAAFSTICSYYTCALTDELFSTILFTLTPMFLRSILEYSELTHS